MYLVLCAALQRLGEAEERHIFGNSRFCDSCADTAASMDSGCQICRTPIRMVLHLYA